MDWQQMNRRASRLARGGVKSSRPNPLRPTTAQALVEFMLISVPLLATMFGIFEFGLAFWDIQQLAQVTREAARETASCSNQCDTVAPDSSGAPDPQRVYKDMRALQAVVDKNSYQRNGTKLNPVNINYIIIRRVADAVGTGSSDSFTLNSPVDLTSTDIKGQYQVYVTKFVTGSDGVSRPDTAGSYLPFKDPDATQLAAVMADAGITDMPNAGTDNTSYLSSPCSTSTLPGSPPGTGTGRITDANKDGQGSFVYSCLYSGATGKSNDPKYNWSRGRPICQPADRFYLEISYRHYWATPFFPEVGVAVSRPKNDSGFVTIKQRVYLKVEPNYFPISGAACPTGLS